MKWSFTSVGLIVFGLIGITIILLFEQITTSNESDYYLLKEVTNAAMVDAIDIKYYRDTGNLKINREKFVENFTRRYSESTLFIGTKHIISFFDIMEIPPKVTILIDTGLGQYRIYNDVSNYNVQNALSGILEYNGKEVNDATGSKKVYVTKTYLQDYYSMSKGSLIMEPVNIPEILKQPNIINQKIKDINIIGLVQSQEELLIAKLMREIDWARASNEIDYRTNFSDGMNIDDYSKDWSLSEKGYYNCSDNSGTRQSGMECDKYNLPWVYIKGTTDNKIILKYTITWEYEEYEFA